MLMSLQIPVDFVAVEGDKVHMIQQLRMELQLQQLPGYCHIIGSAFCCYMCDVSATTLVPWTPMVGPTLLKWGVWGKIIPSKMWGAWSGDDSLLGGKGGCEQIFLLKYGSLDMRSDD